MDILHGLLSVSGVPRETYSCPHGFLLLWLVCGRHLQNVRTLNTCGTPLLLLDILYGHVWDSSHTGCRCRETEVSLLDDFDCDILLG